MISSEFNIQVGTSKDWRDNGPFCLINPPATKIKRLVEIGRGVEGVTLAVAHTRCHKSSKCCKRVCSNTFRICIFHWKNFKWLKSVSISVPDTNANLKTILKLSGKRDSDLLFYHESTPHIEIRNSCSLKKICTFNLEAICNELNLTQYYQELRSSLDPVYVSSLSKLLLCLDSIIVLSDRQGTSQVIYKSEKQDKRGSFMRAYYNSAMNKAFVQSSTQIVLFDFDEKGVCGSRILQNPLAGKNLNIVNWVPSEGFIIYSSRTIYNKEDIYFVDYLGAEPRLRFVLKDKLPGQVCYCVKKNALIYLEEDYCLQKLARCVWLSTIREDYGDELQGARNQEDETYEQIIEGEILAVIPDSYQKCSKIIVNFYGGVLVAIPLPHDVSFFSS